MTSHNKKEGVLTFVTVFLFFYLEHLILHAAVLVECNEWFSPGHYLYLMLQTMMGFFGKDVSFDSLSNSAMGNRLRHASGPVPRVRE